ncbi:MAG: DUF427 domain-containing protein [Propionibacteriaceae bacterium]|nr:DUF427 domain-containing protein [Propionibacteriaceae bacterium]
MATAMRKLLWRANGELRYHPVRKWVRAMVDDRTVVDSRDVFLVWEPRRVVGSYAVPEHDVQGELVPAPPTGTPERPVHIEEAPPVLDPHTPFAVHSTPGTPLSVRLPDRELPGAAFRPDDSDLRGHVILDWAAFTRWFEEDEPVLAHPHDPFGRIDCLRSSRHVQVLHKGTTLADTTRPTLLFETPLPTRFYLPREDVAMELLQPSASHTVCAYKGRASYYSARVGGDVLADIAWYYPEPLHDAAPVRDLVCFYTERLDLVVDGEPQARPRTPWA